MWFLACGVGVAEKGLRTNKSLDIVGVVGDDALAEDTASRVGDEDIVLQTDATEVFVGFEEVVVDELLVEAFGTPFVNKGGNEVDAGFVGEHPAGLYAAAAAQTIGAELRRGANLIVETYVDLSEAFHIVDVHAHHMAKSVLKEHGVGTGGDGIVRIAAHEAEVLETVRHEAADVKMHVHPFKVGTSLLDDEVVACFNDGINVALTRGEATADGSDTGVVRAIVVHRLCTGVAQHEASSFQGAQGGVTVEYLTMHAEDGVEGDLAAVGAGDALEQASNVFLRDARATGLHGCSVHLVSDGHGTFDFGDFIGTFDGAHVHDSLDEG